jgi:hypothetical protein
MFAQVMDMLRGLIGVLNTGAGVLCRNLSWKGAGFSDDDGYI